MSFWWIILQIVPILVILYFYIHSKYQYWSNRGVKGPTPSIFQLGNVFQFNGRDPLKVELEMLAKYGKLYGNYIGLQPALTISEPELIKLVLIKDFHLFVNRRQLNTYHEMANNTLFFSDAREWKRMRTITNPTFSTGKLRKLAPIMNRCVDKFVNYLDSLATTGDGKIEDIKDATIGFTIEVIAATSFGAQTNSNGTEQSPFVVHGLNLSKVSPIRALIYLTMPRWFNDLVNIQHVFNVETINFFTETKKELLKQRKSQKNSSTKQNDLIQLLIDAFADENEIEKDSFDNLAASMENDFVIQNSTNVKNKATMSEQEIIGVAAGIFMAGFDTTALTISSCIHELLLQRDLVDRLYEELDENLADLDVNSDQYLDTVMKQLPYLDAVVKETLRMYPALVRVERRLSAEKYKLGEINLRKDQFVEISVMAVYYNPEFYPSPFHFNPSRFMPEQKHLLVPYAYIPFGDGPRNCIGMRYAYQEIKLCLARIVRKFKFSPTADTPKDAQFFPFRFILNPQQFPVKIEKRV